MFVSKTKLHFRTCDRCGEPYKTPYRTSICCPKCYKPNARNANKKGYFLSTLIKKGNVK
jgi:predicted amidophosphoribosyltransferase